MRFISNGDFLFPLSWPTYAHQQFYTWDYQSGAGNPDGIIRMPGRLLDLLIFIICGNVGFGYFYLISSMLVGFASFYLFAKYFLEIKRFAVQFFGALLFVINPIVLGNLAKVGLVLAASLLPLCLIAIKYAFNHRSVSWLLLWVILLNLSLLHPYTFLVNAFVSFCYFAYRAWFAKPFIGKNIPKLLLLGVVALLLNMYFLLPQAAQGTVSKDVLTNSIASSPTDYTALVDVSNTGDIFTGLSLSKNVLKDFDFYDATYQPVYFVGAFLLYIILFAAFVRVEQRLSRRDRALFMLTLGAFLVLILLSTVKFLHVDVLIKFMIQLPGGWAFRSPLKWQLYLPLVLSTMLVIALSYIRGRMKRKLLFTGLILSILLMNGYVATDVYHRILTPRTISTFAALEQTNLTHKNVLFINSDKCIAYETDNPRITTELNQVLISKDTQVKRISQANADTVNVGSFDYVLDCQNSSQQLLTKSYNFDKVHAFADGGFALYKNRAPEPYVSATSRVYGITDPIQIGDKYDFATQILHSGFNFADPNDKHKTTAPLENLQDAFGDISFKNIQNKRVISDVTLQQDGEQSLYMREAKEPLYYQQTGNTISLSSKAKDGFTKAEPKDGSSQLAVNGQRGQTLHFSYDDPTYNYKNLMPNSSLESGAWQDKVDDCYNVDGTPAQLKMSLSKADKTDGQQSLELQAASHIACTGPEQISIKPGQQYLLDFDYKDLGGQYAGYYIGFDDDAETSVNGRMKTTDFKNWQNFSRTVTAPAGAKHLRFLVYTYPDSSGVRPGVARFDNFKLAAIPNVQNRFYLLKNTGANFEKPAKVTYQTANPTKTSIDISGAKTPFFLTTRETYTAQWRLELDNAKAQSSWPFAHPHILQADHHLKLNGSQNGWFVDPAELCKTSNVACHQNADGSYDLKLVMEFGPQRWFYLGAAISGLTALATAVYFGRHLRFSRDKGKYVRWRK